MRNRILPIVLGVGVFIAGLVVATPLSAHGEGGGTHPDCVHHRSYARYSGSGYNHVVTVENRCEQPVSCQVATNVDRERHSLRVPAGETESITTRIGSPAYGFHEIVDCQQ